MRLYSEGKMPSGSVVVKRVYDDGIEKTVSGDNVIVNDSRNTILQLLAGEGNGKIITHVGLGEDGTAQSADDSSLSNLELVPIHDKTYPEHGKILFKATVNKNVSVGKKIREFGLICDDGTLFARIATKCIEKDAIFKLNIEWLIGF